MGRNGALAVVAAGALVLRVLLIAPVHSTGYTSDEREYQFISEQLVRGETFRDSNGEYSTRAPLYPYLLAGVHLVAGAAVIVPHLVGVLLGTAVVVLAYIVVLKTLGDRKRAILAAGAAAVYPGLVIYSVLLQTEMLYTALLLCALLFAWDVAEEPGSLKAAAVGLASGLAALTRAVAVGFFPILVLVIWAMMRRTKTVSYSSLAVMVIVWCAVLAPWGVRNYQIHGALVPVSSGGGNSLLTGNNPYATGTWSVGSGFAAWYEGQARMLGVSDVSLLSEVERSALSGRIALDYILSHPYEVLLLAVKKAYIFWVYPIAHTDSNVPVQLVAVAADGILYLGTAVGVVVLWAHRWRLLPALAAIGFFSLVHMGLHSESRFRLPIVPLLVIGFACGAAELLDRQGLRSLVRDRWRRRWVLGLAGVVVAVYALTGALFLKGLV